MVADGKENQHPNSPNLQNQSTGAKLTQTIFENQINKTQLNRPLLFSEILFSNNSCSNNNDYNNVNFFSTTCTSPIPSPSNVR